MTTDTDQPCTQADRDAIVAAAHDRARYLEWLASYLLKSADINLRTEAAKQLRQLAQGA